MRPRKPGGDPKDAQVILRMLEIGAVQVFHDPLVAGTCDIQELSKTYEMMARAKTELWHRILPITCRCISQRRAGSTAVQEVTGSWPFSRPFRPPT